MTQEVLVPDIGDVADVEVVEVLVKAGDQVNVDDSLITLESDKASMEVPSTLAGIVEKVMVATGDRVSEGSPILAIQVKSSDADNSPSNNELLDQASLGKNPPVTQDSPAEQPKAEAPVKQASRMEEEPTQAPGPVGPVARPEANSGNKKAHASPAIRRFARELGADLDKIIGTGHKGRILKEDVQAFVKASLQKKSSGGSAGIGFNFDEAPAIDFSQFGEIESKPLSRIKKISGAHLHRSWVSIPHVTQYGDADITDLEAFRKGMGGEAQKQDIKLTFLPFLLKAVVAVLQRFPEFNASLAPGGEDLILKRYYHIGVAVDTEDGLVVPVIRDADKKGVYALAQELTDLSQRARDKKLKPADMQGGTFTISSLGGIGGTSFTPIINAPEVAILGVSRAKMQPVHDGNDFQPRLMLPLSLSYDHRVIDGASGARFIVALGEVLNDMRRVLL